MKKEHHYALRTVWTGNRGSGTSDYAAYGREHRIEIDGKAPLNCSSDAPFRGNPALHNPEDMMLSALSACHMLWYLHLCADAGIIVLDYQDDATATLIQDGPGGAFHDALLRPQVRIAAGSDAEKALALHDDAHRSCFIANSVRFPVRHEPQISKEPADAAGQ